MTLVGLRCGSWGLGLHVAVLTSWRSDQCDGNLNTRSVVLTACTNVLSILDSLRSACGMGEGSSTASKHPVLRLTWALPKWENRFYRVCSSMRWCAPNRSEFSAGLREG